MRKLLVFTDIHFLEDGGKIIGLDPVERFEAGLAHALQRHRDAERIIITGDLTHHGHPAEFARLRRSLSGCPLPVDLMVGNHDRRAAFRAAFPETPVTDAGFVQSFRDIDDYRLILLDTLDEEAEIEHSGLLCTHRLDWMDRAISSAGDRQVIIFTHHPPIVTGFAGMDRIGLKNRAEMADRLRAHSNVCQIISGHVHRTMSGSAAGIPTALFKSPCHQMPMALADDDEHLSIDEPGAYGLLLLGDDGVIVHTEDFGLQTSQPAS
ncbi:phosphodiesterase [uncultured Hoeflea sp.]|uniref:phosphodiesterase n=1 Tax=uncultured Hoeflea sp. TaxID=538666 RepID=UPI00262128C4|nr:phosphodiesterase [uncultured Hoeflea sp.]